ncbi:aspartate aminotransferase family protein [Thermogladius sp. 4427co]|uniref:aspartate aminotransferase family protein n=1 Tax=Thermogladius sp. 4427co TaxID=3450718 RepID=UPI003F78FB6F
MRFANNPKIEEKIKVVYEEYERYYTEKTKGSKDLYERALRLFPAGVTYSIRFFHPYPLYIVKAMSTRIWDVDGNEYIDFWMGHGVHLLGHLHRVVVDAVKEVLERGTHLGFEHPYVVEYAELLTKIVPGLESIRFTNSGTEANMYAVRLARAYTGRKYIVKIEGGWHGAVDSLLYMVRRFNGTPESAGLLEDYIKYTIVVPFNDVEILEKILKEYEVAAVILEPVMGAAGCIEPDKGYLKEVRRLVDEKSSLLIFDEVITGFRLAPGGAQEYYGVKADIVIYGKALGGGVGSVGAIGGRSDIMELLNHIKKKPRELVFHGGTFAANPVVTSAGYAMVKYLAEHKELYEKSNNIWSWFRRKVEEKCSEYSIDCWATGEGSLTGIHFTKKKPRNARQAEEYRWSTLIERALHLYSRVHGLLYISETKPHFLPSLIHSREEVEKLLEVFENFLSIISAN